MTYDIVHKIYQSIRLHRAHLTDLRLPMNHQSPGRSDTTRALQVHRPSQAVTGAAYFGLNDVLLLQILCPPPGIFCRYSHALPLHCPENKFELSPSFPWTGVCLSLDWCVSNCPMTLKKRKDFLRILECKLRQSYVGHSQVLVSALAGPIWTFDRLRIPHVVLPMSCITFHRLTFNPLGSFSGPIQTFLGL